MKATIYKIIIFDAEKNESIVDPLIFWDRDAALREARRIYDDCEVIADSIKVYEEWGIAPSCFFKCSVKHNPEQKHRLDRYALEEVGDEPAKYGYVKIEGEGNVDYSDNRIVICAETEEDLEFAYNQVADAFLNHPGVIDLRTYGKTEIRII